MSDQRDFEIGNIVTLKSGGPHMTIEDIRSDGAICVWFNQGKLESHLFAFGAIKKVPMEQS